MHFVTPSFAAPTLRTALRTNKATRRIWAVLSMFPSQNLTRLRFSPTLSPAKSAFLNAKSAAVTQLSPTTLLKKEPRLSTTSMMRGTAKLDRKPFHSTARRWSRSSWSSGTEAGANSVSKCTASLSVPNPSLRARAAPARFSFAMGCPQLKLRTGPGAWQNSGSCSSDIARSVAHESARCTENVARAARAVWALSRLCWIFEKFVNACRATPITSSRLTRKLTD